jgi:hypothetical protein
MGANSVRRERKKPILVTIQLHVFSYDSYLTLNTWWEREKKKLILYAITHHIK